MTYRRVCSTGDIGSLASPERIVRWSTQTVESYPALGRDLIQIASSSNPGPNVDTYHEIGGRVLVSRTLSTMDERPFAPRTAISYFLR